MTDKLADLGHLPSSDVALRALHAEIERLATAAATSYVSRNPLRVDHVPGDRTAGGDVPDLPVQVWHDGALIVRSCDGGVFLTAHPQILKRRRAR